MPHGKPSKLAAEWARVGTDRRHRLRAALVERDGTNCRHCGRPTRLLPGKQAPDAMTIDHWPVPKRLLPKDQWLDPSRAVIACQECNQRLNRADQANPKAAGERAATTQE